MTDDTIRRGLVKLVLGNEGTYHFLREERPEDIPEGAGTGAKAIARDVLLAVEKAAWLCSDMDLERWLKIYDKDEHPGMIAQDQNSLMCRMRGEMNDYARRIVKGMRQIPIEETPEGAMPIFVEIDVPERRVLVTPYLYRAVEDADATRADAALGRLARFGFSIDYSQKPEHQPFRGLCRARDI